MFKSLTLLKEYTKISLATAMEYRANFITQVVAMFLNDVVWILFWWIFFTRFSVVSGWTLNDIIVLYAVVTLSFGVSGFFFGNRSKLSSLIAEGKLDFYLSLPRGELWHILISYSSSFVMGDILFGLALAIFSLSPIKWPLFLLLTIFSTILIISFGIIVGSLGFFWGNAEETSDKLFMGLIAFGSYPLPLFKGFARFILLLIIPAGFVGSVPVELLRVFSWEWFLYLVGITGIFLILAIIVFRIGLKRYESGNMMTTRI